MEVNNSITTNTKNFVHGKEAADMETWELHLGEYHSVDMQETYHGKM